MTDLLRKNSNFLMLILIASIFRTILSFLPAFEYDQNSFRFWSLKLAEQGLNNFYSSNFFTSNPVGFFYPLWIIGSFIIHFAPEISRDKQIFDLLLKLPANISDLIAGILIFCLVSKTVNEKWGIIGFILYVFNPAIFFNSSIWGQYDGIAALFLFLTFYFISIKKSPEIGLGFYALAWTLKPQATALLPIIILIILIKYAPLKWFTSTLSLIFTALLIYFPFFPANPVNGLISVNLGSANLFRCTSCFAFNFWGIFGNWNDDLQKFAGIAYLHWGMILFSIFLVILFFLKPFLKKYHPPYLFITTAMSVFTFFMFLTRMHERYLFPFFVFFLSGTLLLKSRIFIVFYLLISLLHLVNLYIPYTYYNKQLNLPVIFTNDFSQYTRQFSFILLAIFLSLFFYFLKRVSEPKCK